MDARQRRTASVTSAGALAVLTLVVFFVSLNKGPASAVTRFHEGLSRPDGFLLRQVTGGDINSEAAIVLRRNVSRLLGQGATFQVTRVQKDGPYARVIVVYRGASPDSVLFVPFALYKSQGVWLIDSAATLALVGP